MWDNLSIQRGVTVADFNTDFTANARIAQFKYKSVSLQKNTKQQIQGTERIKMAKLCTPHPSPCTNIFLEIDQQMPILLAQGQHDGKCHSLHQMNSWALEECLSVPGDVTGTT